MKPLLIVLVILSWNIAHSQSYYLDTLPKFNYMNGVSLQVKTPGSSIGVNYERNFWNGMGYRNYSNISIGGFYGYSQLVDPRKVVGFDFRAQHNHRLGLKRLLYFSTQVGYSPMLPIKKSTDKLYDDYINSGYISIGLTGYVGHLKMALFSGVGVRETRQELYYSIHTYAQFFPELKLAIGYSFGQKID